MLQVMSVIVLALFVLGLISYFYAGNGKDLSDSLELTLFWLFLIAIGIIVIFGVIISVLILADFFPCI